MSNNQGAHATIVVISTAEGLIVGEEAAVRVADIRTTPRIALCCDTTTGGELPLSLRGQTEIVHVLIVDVGQIVVEEFAAPDAECLGLEPADTHHRVVVVCCGAEIVAGEVVVH